MTRSIPWTRPGTRTMAALFGAAFVARTAVDWFAPTHDFRTRSAVSTAAGVAILLAAGCLAAWRSGSLTSGTVAGVATAAMGAVVSILGVSAMLALRHDPATLAAARDSGGLGEVFTLPLLMVLPGIVLGTVGGLIGATLLPRSSG